MPEYQVKYQNLGSNFAVLIKGTHEAVQRAFYSFWNHGATDAELTELWDDEYYFWTTKDRLVKYFKNLFYHRALNQLEDVCWVIDHLAYRVNLIWLEYGNPFGSLKRLESTCYKKAKKAVDNLPMTDKIYLKRQKQYVIYDYPKGCTGLNNTYENNGNNTNT